MKILIRGSSIAAGKGVVRGYGHMLDESFSHRGWELINCSRIGETSFDCVETFHRDITPHKPQILVIHFGIEDAYFPVYRSEFKENLVQAVRLARRSWDPVIMLMTSHPFEDPYDMDMINIYYRTVREVALDLECELVPVHTWWQGIIIEKNTATSHYVQKDTRLPNEAGQRIYAEFLERRIGEAVKKLIVS